MILYVYIHSMYVHEWYMYNVGMYYIPTQEREASSVWT